VGYVRLLRQRRILLLWGAQTLSVLGDRMYALAVIWLVWDATRSAALTGVVAVAESLPYILVGTAGRRLAARFAALGRLAVLDVARMLTVAALPIVWAWSGPSVPMLLVVAAVLGLLGALFDPNLGVLVPDLVRPDQVQAVTGLMDLMGRIARIAGPGTAGLLLAVISDVQLYLVDAATFGISAAALALLARRVRPTEGSAVTAPTPSVRPRARELLRAYPVTGCMVALHAAGQLLLGVSLVLPALLAARGGGGAQMYAAAMTATGIGAVAANAVAGNARWATVIPGAYCAAWAASGVVTAATGAAMAAWQIVVLSAAAGAVGPFTAVALRTHLSGFERGERAAWMMFDQTALRTAGTAGTLVLPMLAAPAPAAAYVAAGAGTVAVAAAAWAAAAVLGRGRAARRREPELSRARL